MGETQTHPVYIDQDRKSEVKKESVDLDTSMKEVTERLVQHGMELGLHKVPLDEPVEFRETDSGWEAVVPEDDDE